MAKISAMDSFFCDQNKVEEKKNQSTNIHQTSLNGDPRGLKIKNEGFGLIRVTVYWITDCSNQLNINCGSAPRVVKSPIEAKCFRFRSLVSSCPGSPLSKVWQRSVLWIIFLFILKMNCIRKILSVFVKLNSMVVQVFLKLKIKVLGSYALQFTVQLTLLTC